MPSNIRLRQVSTIVLVLLLSACGSSGIVQETRLATVTLPLYPTVTNTPFLPEGFWEPSPTTHPETMEGTQQDGVAIPPMANVLDLPQGIVTFMLLGSDLRPGRGDFRTDVMVLLVLRPDGSVSLTSFPRDLYIYLPGWNMSRMNAACEYGGFDLLAQAMNYNFGFQPQHFILINFDGFQDIIDSLGGVDVYVAITLSDTRTGFPDGFIITEGLNHMDGETALWYVRSRGTSSDFDRLRRAQEVLMGIGHKLLSLQGLTRIPELYDAYKGSIVTDVNLDGLLALIPILQAADANRVERYVITPPLVTVWIEPGSGAYYLLPERSSLRSLFQQALGIH